MTIYWVNLEVTFLEKMPVLNSEGYSIPGNVTGFLQEFGCTAINESDLKEIVLSYIMELEWLDVEKANITFSRIGEISQNDLNAEVHNDPDINTSIIADPQKIGIWYRSGRAFFSENEESDEIFKAKVKQLEGRQED